MNKDLLLESAEKLKQVSNEASTEYDRKAEKLTSRMNAKMAERPDIEDLVGKNNLDMMKDNHANHVRFIASILKNHNTFVLVETILWVFRAYRSHGFTTNYWAAQLNSWIIILKAELSAPALDEILPYYEWMQVNIPLFVMVSDEKLMSPDQLH